MPTWLIILLILVLFAGGVLAGLKLSTISEPTGLWARMFPDGTCGKRETGSEYKA